MAIVNISAILAIVCIANIPSIISQPMSKGFFSTNPDQRISINYQSSMNDQSSESISVNGYGKADSADSGKFILAGRSPGNSRPYESVCIEGTMGLRNNSWTIIGVVGKKSLTGSGKWNMDFNSSSSGIFEVPKENLTVTDSGDQMPAVCGELRPGNSYNTGNQDFTYSWGGTTKWMNSKVEWTVSGTRTSRSESHTISGLNPTINSNGVLPTGCLISLNIDNNSNYFSGSGHIDGRGLQVSGRIQNGMYIADMVSVSPNSGTPAFMGRYSNFPGSSSVSFLSSAGSNVRGKVFANGTWTTDTDSSGNLLTGTYSTGTFQGTGTISYMNATFSGKYGASCWFTDSAIITCPIIAPDTTIDHYFTNGSFYLCGTATPETNNKTQFMASGWKFISKNQSDPMQLTAEAITVSVDMETDSMSPAGDDKTMVVSITDSTGAQSFLSLKGYLYSYMQQISGSLKNGKASVSITNSKVIGSNVVVTGTMMSI